MSTLSAAPLTQVHGSRRTTATSPPEERGLARDEVRLLVVTDEGVSHARFRDLPNHLRPGDLVVVNNSATLAAELDGRRVLEGRPAPVVVHAATRLDDETWVVEVRTAPDGARAILDLEPGERIELADHVQLRLLAPHPRPTSSPTGHGNRLWRVSVTGPRTLDEHLARHGRPIAYGYLDRRYPLAAYQTVFATRPGSAEMPSAARPFTPEIVTRLISAGVGVATVTLHTGVSSQESGEAPQAEWRDVPGVTARLVTATRAEGGRVVAVGTTVTRALESAVGPDGLVHAAQGWTDRVVSRDDPARVVDGLVTGWHDPDASHLLLVEAVAGPELTQRAYDAAVAGGYLWHEFGDAALLLPGPSLTGLASTHDSR